MHHPFDDDDHRDGGWLSNLEQYITGSTIVFLFPKER